MSRSEELQELSLHQTLERCVWHKGKWCHRKDQSEAHVIVRIFPRLSPSPEDPNYEEYCRIKIMLHHPFRDLATLQ